MNKVLVNNVNKYLADVGVSYIKLHNLHWNVVGEQFKAVHEYLEELYESFATVLDDTAEILRINGETPLASMKEYLAVSTIEELDGSDKSIASVLKIVTEDLNSLKKEALSIRAEADEDGNFDIANLMEDHLKDYSKALWFLSAMRK